MRAPRTASRRSTPRRWTATARSSTRCSRARRIPTPSTATGRGDATRRLLDHGANPNARDKRGNTALHGAADGGHIEIVVLLLSRKAERNVRNADGLTPADIARARGYGDVLKALGAR